MPTRSRVSAGLRFSKVSPFEESTHSPSIKFLKTRVWLSLRLAGGAKVSVAIMSPCLLRTMNAQTLMLQPAGKERQGGWVLGVVCLARQKELNRRHAEQLGGPQGKSGGSHHQLPQSCLL